MSNMIFLRRQFAPAVLLIFFAQLQATSGTAKNDGGFVIYPGSKPGPVVFSHAAHGKGKAGYLCDKCHSTNSEKALRITMGDIRQGKACGSCHDGRTKGINGKPAANATECGACHMPATDVVFNLNRMDPVRFSHVRHLSSDADKKAVKPTGFSCGDCHPAPFDRDAAGSFEMKAPHENSGCVHCHDGLKHNGRAVFAANTRCLTCHRSPESN
jgi:c(7)-type cytochrome triheme protein